MGVKESQRCEPWKGRGEMRPERWAEPHSEGRDGAPGGRGGVRAWPGVLAVVWRARSRQRESTCEAASERGRWEAGVKQGQSFKR